MTLREKIEKLPECCGQVRLAEVLRIVAEHERQQVCAMCEVELNTEQAIKDGTLPVLDLTPGMQPRKGGGADSGRTASGRQPPNVTAPPAGQAGGQQSEPAETPRWRKELDALRMKDALTIGMGGMSQEERMRYWALNDLAALAKVIASGRGQAVVPTGVAKLLDMNLPAQWMARRDHGEVICTHSTWAPYIWGPAAFMRIVDEYGDSLCGAP